ncbi:porin family protein [Cesiribacter andamanensis]|uniref:Outer membrane protein beta-barrel domain-containing protein n=1 Tax=Cesiribacter andamanensis AMV16 TaxID=1279009 RepID=M7N914_9BACT|nr:porin family protein [Cesiribacter andamanensis]EMR03742.1 hypothetical protein ADICEAN_01080 [Cesiribacter andamanensis AMV16]
MRYLTIALLPLLLVPILAGAQVHRSYTRSVPEMQFLLKSAWQYTQLQESGFTAEGRSGWAAGMGVKLPFSRFWWMQPEIMLSQRAAALQYPETGTGQVYTVAYTFRYVEIPLLLNFRANDIIEFQLGPQMSTLIRNSSVADAGGQNPNLPPSELGRWDIAAAAGLELNVSPLAFGARYVRGFRDVAATDLARQWLGSGRLQGLHVYGALVF